MAYQFGMRLLSRVGTLSGLPRRDCAAATAINNRGGGPVLVTETLTSSQLWIAPMGVSLLIALTGCGGAGTPESSGSYTEYTINQYNVRKIYYLDDSVETFDDNTVDSTAGPYYSPQSVPAPYCDPQHQAPPPYAPGVMEADCYRFTQTSEEVPYTDPATTGGSTTGFNQTFPGGFGGAATASTVRNVSIAAGSTYALTIPAGGSMTFSYYKP
ncbi:MAG: hypothetical protein ACXW2U_05505 [Telluria sp.]